MNLIKFEFR